jgi:hypothetical protein
MGHCILSLATGIIATIVTSSAICIGNFSPLTIIAIIEQTKIVRGRSPEIIIICIFIILSCEAVELCYIEAVEHVKGLTSFQRLNIIINLVSP